MDTEEHRFRLALADRIESEKLPHWREQLRTLDFVGAPRGTDGTTGHRVALRRHISDAEVDIANLRSGLPV